MPTSVVHFMTPPGDTDVANPASVPVMMLPSLLTVGDVVERPWLDMSQLRLPFAKNDATPSDVPTTNPDPLGSIAGVEFVDMPAPPLPYVYISAPVDVLYAPPHRSNSVGVPGREMEPPKSSAPLQLAADGVDHCSCGSVTYPTVDAVRPVRRTVAPRSGQAAEASVPPNTPTATGVTDGEGDVDSVDEELVVIDGVGDGLIVPDDVMDGVTEGVPVADAPSVGDGDGVDALVGEKLGVGDADKAPSDRTIPSESENMMLPSAASAGDEWMDAPVPKE